MYLNIGEKNTVLSNVSVIFNVSDINYNILHNTEIFYLDIIKCVKYINTIIRNIMNLLKVRLTHIVCVCGGGILLEQFL